MNFFSNSPRALDKRPTAAHSHSSLAFIMPKTYLRGNNKRQYGSYDKEVMEMAIKSVKDGATISSVAKMYGIERSTLSRHCAGIHRERVGRPPELNDEEERQLVDMMKQMIDWGFGLDSDDICSFIKRYLDNCGKVEPRFKNNMPGRDLIYSFVKRNNLAGNIKASIAKLDEEDIRAFFDNLEATGDFDPANAFNYDETAVSDDLGRKKVLVPRGTKGV